MKKYRYRIRKPFSRAIYLDSPHRLNLKEIVNYLNNKIDDLIFGVDEIKIEELDIQNTLDCYPIDDNFPGTCEFIDLNNELIYKYA